MNERKGIYVRVSPQLEKQLQKTAKRAQRSLSAEAAFRLEQSLRAENGGKP